MHRVPALETAGVKMLLNGPESFTPDGNFILGEAPEVRNYFVAAGFNSAGIANAGGAGKLLAEWIAGGEAPMDLFEVDIRRFGAFAADAQVAARAHRRDRSACTTRCAGRATSWSRAARSGFRRLYSKIERARAPSSAPSSAGSAPTTSGRRWSTRSAAPTGLPRCSKSNLRSARQSASSTRPRSASCACAAATPPRCSTACARTRSASSPTPRCSTARAASRATSPCSAGPTTTSSSSPARRSRCGIAAWLLRNTEGESRSRIDDVTAEWSVLSVLGPNAQKMFSRRSTWEARGRSPRPTSAGRAPSSTCRSRTRRRCTTGSGRAGKGLGLRDCGYYALDALRIEAGRRAFGPELSPDCTPYEAGLGFAVRPELRKPPAKLAKRLLMFTFPATDLFAWGGEPILRNGKPVGELSSVGYSATLALHGRHGLRLFRGHRRRRYDIEVSGTKVPAKASLKAPWPAGA